MTLAQDTLNYLKNLTKEELHNLCLLSDILPEKFIIYLTQMIKA